MAIDPAPISANPAITISCVFATAPESPAASADGTVSPSDILITMSRTKLHEVRWYSAWGVRAIRFLSPLNVISNIHAPAGLHPSRRDKPAGVPRPQAGSIAHASLQSAWPPKHRQ